MRDTLFRHKAVYRLFTLRPLVLLAFISLQLSTVYAFDMLDMLDNTLTGQKTVFRYRTFQGDRPSWVSDISSSGGIDHSKGSNDIFVIKRGKGFSNFISTDFNGTSEYIKGTEKISSRDNKLNDSFTIQAWFCARSVNGYRTIVSNTSDYKGFSLKIRDGKLRGLVRFDKEKGILKKIRSSVRRDVKFVNQEISGGCIDPDKWYCAALRVKRLDNKYRLRLFLNGIEVAVVDSPECGRIRQSSEHVMIGAEPENSKAKNNFFDGMIYAVSVQNYAVDISNCLSLMPVRDGSRYLGGISYHDYLSGKDGIDMRAKNTASKYPDLDRYLGKKWYCPFLNDNYVPQGISTNGSDMVYLTLYWKDKSGHDKKYPSILVEMTSDGELVRTMPLYKKNQKPLTGHVGGCALWNNYIYIPDGSTIYRFNLSSSGTTRFYSETLENPEQDVNTLTSDDEYKCDLEDNRKISFLSASRDAQGLPFLWTGAFSEKENKRILGFEILSDGSISKKADYIFTLPVVKVQGIFCSSADSSGINFYISTSYGNKSSKIYFAKYTAEHEKCSYHEKKMTGPAGFEDISILDNQLWCVSESGARYYQKRSIASSGVSPWSQFFPYVFYLKLD